MSGKPYTKASKRQHIKSCPRCKNILAREQEDDGMEADPAYQFACDVAGDESDGVFFAIMDGF